MSYEPQDDDAPIYRMKDDTGEWADADTFQQCQRDNCQCQDKENQ